MELDGYESDASGPTMSIARRDINDASGSRVAPIAPPGRTLLPGPIASMVSLATRSTSFALRFGTVISGYGLGAAKFTTLSSLELGRGILEGILSRAGKDVLARSQSEFGRDNAETILEKSLESLHQTMLHMVFWTTAGFHVAETATSSASQISQVLLSTLDHFFGSTDSSKAIASIITLIRHEFRNPATGANGERVGVVDLVLGLCGLAYLQNSCAKIIQEEALRLGHEELIWDVVVLNDGTRADIHDDISSNAYSGTKRRRESNEKVIESIEQDDYHDKSPDDDLSEMYLKAQIMDSLPRGAKASFLTSTTTTKTITVEIEGAGNLPLLAPPGTHLIEREVVSPENQIDFEGRSSTYRLVYQISRERQHRSTSHPLEIDDVKPYDELCEGTGQETTEDLSLGDKGPPVPPKSPRTSRNCESSTSRQESTSSPVRVVPSSPVSPREKSSQIPVLKKSSENAANQKKTRKPLGLTKPSTPLIPTGRESSTARSAGNSETATSNASDKKAGFRNVLKKGSVGGLANLLNKDSNNDENSSRTRKSLGSGAAVDKIGQLKTHPRPSGAIPQRDGSRPPRRENMNSFSSRDLGLGETESGFHRSSSRSSFSNQHQRRRNSIVSQTDTLSIHSLESRPGSPSLYRSSHITKTKAGHETGECSSTKHHSRGKSQLGLYSPSVYTLRTSSSQTSLVLSSYQPKSAYADSEAVDMLRKTGMIDGMFPEFHILRNITRYSRYASAAYGSQFLNLMGIAKGVPLPRTRDETHHDVRSFAHHTELPPDSILLSSFVDPQGGSDSSGSTGTGVPLVHTIAIDEESRAVVLSCRGTLGFEDVLADMMCDYDDLLWRGKAYKVHKGIHASARRLLYGGDGRVLYTLKEALEEFPGFGLVLCGHSLGGAVAALLGAMLAEPATNGTAFVTSAQQHKRLITYGNTLPSSHEPVYLPAGRPIHVFAYGPPATMSPSLRIATRGLITSVIHGNDLVPYLSLGVLHDLQALALAFKTDNSEAKAEVRRRVWQSFQTGLSDKWYNNAPKLSSEDESQWAFAALKTLRVSMMSSKLLPPGEVFVVESRPALRRDAFVQAGGDYIGRSATRIVLKYIRDVETHFGEIKFGASMLTDHSPGRYEDALRRLTLGVI